MSESTNTAQGEPEAIESASGTSIPELQDFLSSNGLPPLPADLLEEITGKLASNPDAKVEWRMGKGNEALEILADLMGGDEEEEDNYLHRNGDLGDLGREVAEFLQQRMRENDPESKKRLCPGCVGTILHNAILSSTRMDDKLVGSEEGALEALLGTMDAVHERNTQTVKRAAIDAAMKSLASGLFGGGRRRATADLDLGNLMSMFKGH